MSSPLSDIEFLTRSEHRVTMLNAMARRPQTRDDLLEMTDVSQSTMGRTLREFEDRDWIRRDGQHYEATQLGAFVASGIEEVISRLEIEQDLRIVSELLPSEESGFKIEMCSDAVVTVADSDNPYRPVNRFLELLRETNQFQFIGFDLALLELCKDELSQMIIDGMHTEIIDPPSVVNHIRSTYPDEFAAVLESGNLTLRVHDDLPPYGLGIFDDRIAIVGYDSESGIVQALIDTDAPEARDWAESIYRSYQRENPTISFETSIE